jgi:hypothetical protein
VPKYRARVHYTNEQGQERCDTFEVESESYRSEEIARAAQDAWEGFQQGGEERLPHNIEWELVE